MKKNEKKGISLGLTVIILGVIGLAYAILTKKTIEANGYMYSLGITYLVTGLIFVMYYIRLSKNKKKSDEQENIYLDERIKNNKDKASRITFRIILWSSILADFIVTFFLEQYKDLADNLNVFIMATIGIYLITYSIISKRN